MTVGHVKVGEEFSLLGKIFKRVGPYLAGIDSDIKDKLYQIKVLPDAVTGYAVTGHQNCIIVQDKASGGFFFCECCLDISEGIK